MDTAAGVVLSTAHELYTRANDTSTDTSSSTTDSRPPVYKVIGICLAIGSGLFIGTSFVLKKVGLLKANEKYKEEAGEGYGYLKNAYWWTGMTLMILGEILNFVAYAFTDAILVTPLGALSVVITTILSAIFLKERLSMVGKVACFLCIVGSVVIVMNAPEESSVSDIQQMQHYVIAPGFLTYAGIIIVGSAIVAFFVAPKYGKKNMLVYISICSWVGGLSVSATQGLGAAIVAQIGGKPQFNQWFLYVLLVFVVGTLLTEIIFLNKALNLFNAALVTPTYYVYFTSTTIITSAVLFQGFKGTPTSIATVVMGFLVICSGVVLLQLSKSAKDVPDAALFAGDLNQIHTIAEQEQPESEPKADAIRGAAALVRRFSTAREKMEIEELKRLRMEKEQDRLESLSENGQPQFEWDGLRRRRTTLVSQRSRAMTTPSQPNTGSPHPPLGMSHFPTEQDLADNDRPFSAGLSSIVGTIRSRATSVLPGHPDFRGTPLNDSQNALNISTHKMQSPMHPVQLTEMSVAPGTHYGVPAGFKTEYDNGSGDVSMSSTSRHVQFGGELRHTPDVESLAPPTPPPHASAKRQFSFQNVFKRHREHGSETIDDRPMSSRSAGRPSSGRGRGHSNPHAKTATEEERLGLVMGDSATEHSRGGYSSTTAMPAYEEDDSYDDDRSDSFDDDVMPYTDDKLTRYGRGITETSPPRGTRIERGRGGSGSSSGGDEKSGMSVAEVIEYEEQRRKWHESRSRSGSRDQIPPTPPPKPPKHGGSSGTPGSQRGGGSAGGGYGTPRGGGARGAYM
ncbi:Magnesium transporter NIPA2 [Cytospora mali]|uniref:Magnesium transporter NIPA2 n=1 Tax=Cytospora mali TaxID=578113 RepID=A0A194USB4_CYTMA|nr:Magnesium transporter NIPA2 [Valsa mali var. pyri (nom. inval.)]